MTFKSAVTAVAMFLVGVSCGKVAPERPVDNEMQLFRPRQYKEPVVSQNTILYSWYASLETDTYRVQIGKDKTFGKCEVDETMTGTSFEARGLSYDKTYYARIMCICTKDESRNSEWTSMSSVVTEVRIVPSVLKDVDEDTDYVDNVMYLKWDNSYNVTRIALKGLGGVDYSREIILDDTARKAGTIAVSDLPERSSFQATIYDDTKELEEEKSYNTVSFSTPKILPPDNRESAILLSIGDDLKAAVEAAPAGSSIMLPRGYVYAVDSKAGIVTIDKDITIFGAHPGEFEGQLGERPVISLTYSYSLLLTGNLEYVKFEGIDFVTTAPGTKYCSIYVNNANISSFVLENCRFNQNYTACVGLGTSAKNISDMDLFLIKDCLFDNNGWNNGLIYGQGTNTVADFTCRKTVFSCFGCSIVKTSSSFPESSKMTFRNCVFYKNNRNYSFTTNANGKKMFDIAAAENVVLSLNKCLFTCSGDSSGKTSISNMPSSGILDTSGSFYTNDFGIDPNGGVPVLVPLSVPVGDVFVDPEGLDFTYKTEKYRSIGPGTEFNWNQR